MKEIRKIVREGYAEVARQKKSCCTPAKSCCSSGSAGSSDKISRNIGYTDADLKSLPEGADLGLGCGNPVALASLKEGEVVLDLGSGAGIDCFLASKKVGLKGRVIGVDMTPEMLDRARENAKKGNYTNVEFRLGEIEHLPAADGSIDAIISNCVINLSPDKDAVFNEAFRVLKPGGRIMVSDIVIMKELPASVKESVQMYVGCLAGALKRADYLGRIAKAGFSDIRVIDESYYPVDLMVNDPAVKVILKDVKITPEEMNGIGHSVASIKVHAKKNDCDNNLN